MSSPKISIIVPVYNVEKYLKKCLDSLLAQSLKEIEILCVNDGSTDGSLKVLEAYAKKDKRISVIDKMNGGLSSARNVGLKKAKGEYIGFVDSDDWVDAKMYEKLYNKAVKTNSDITICSLHIFDSQTGGLKYNDPYYTLGAFPGYLDNKVFSPSAVKDTMFTVCVTAVDKIYKKDLIESTGVTFPEGLTFEDNPFFYKVFLAANRISLVREPLYYYRLNREGAITAESTRKHFDIIKIQNMISDIFKESGQYPGYQQKLLEIKIYCLFDIYKKLSPSLAVEYLGLVKDDFEGMNPSNLQLVKLPIELKNFYLGVRRLKDFDEEGLAETMRSADIEFNEAQRTFRLRVYKKLMPVSFVSKKFIGKIFNLQYSGLRGLRELLLDLARIIKRILLGVLRAVRRQLEPLKLYIAERLDDRTKRAIKYLIHWEFLSIKVVEVNTKWEGPLVTVVSTFYNQAGTILETSDSVLGQYFQNFEYIIVNDGSKPEERKALDKINDKRVRVVDSEHVGFGSPAAARNIGIHQAKGKYIMCLDGDDKLDPTYLEKFVTVLETNHNIDIVTSNMRMFGSVDSTCLFGKFKAQRLFRQTIIHCASMFRADLLKKVDGFKQGIGYEDWEFWVSLVESGANALNIQDRVFIYRVLENSRYTEDIKKHRDNFLKIVSLHRLYRLKVALWQTKRFFIKKVVDKKTAYINLGPENFNRPEKNHILVALPWMVYGGAETLVTNLAGQLAGKFEFTFITGLYSDNDFEDDFRKISNRIYHLPGLYSDRKEYLGFLVNYIRTRDVKILHIFHTGYLFSYLSELKAQCPELRIVVTIFNDKVNYFDLALSQAKHIDLFTSDNKLIVKKYKDYCPSSAAISITNGLDVDGRFNSESYNKSTIRKELSLPQDKKLVLFVGRMSEEKNPEFVLKLSELTRENEGTQYILLGEGPELTKLWKKYKPNKNVHYIGYKKDVEKYYAAADFFILPSKAEGSPQSIAEAMSMGLVVLAAPVGGIPELISNNKTGYLIDTDNPQAAIELLAKNNSEISKEARRLASKMFDLGAMAESYTKLYGKMVKK